MIPQFPKFKKLELSDKSDVEKFTLRHPPYSDFNFAGTWSWDVREQMQISQFNGNYIIRFIDYLTGEPFYTFLGNNDVNNTAKKLLDLSKKEGLKSELKLIPDDSVEFFDKNIFKIEEDHNNHDYIVPAEVFRDYNTKKTRDKRNLVKKFLNEFSPRTEILNLSNSSVKKSVYNLYKKWSSNKNNHEIEDEWCALERILNESFLRDQICIGIFLKEDLVGFCLNELLPNGFACIHFSKADVSVSQGIYSYLLQENAKLLLEKERKFINLEQDLGIPGLKKWKMGHGLNIFLKKYIIRYNDKVV